MKLPPTKLAFSAAAALLLALHAPVSRADGDASELKRAADALMEARRYDEAVVAYDVALAKAPSPELLYSRGRALQFLGRHPEALASFERFRDEAPPALRARVSDLDGLIAEVRAKVTRLSLRCSVPGARVMVRDKLVGTTPLKEPLALSAGRATIEITAEGFAPYRVVADLPGGGAYSLDASLVALDASAVLIVKSDVAHASVSVDGRPVGSAPVEAVVTAGSHKVRVSHEGYTDVESAFVVRVGEHRTVSLDPERPVAITSRWWFWTSVGVAVAGGVVLGVALSTERPGATGDFSPGRASAPLVRFP